MRLPEDKIKEAILHPDPDLRSRAVHYFSKSYSQDPSIMPLVIQAVEKYGIEEATGILVASRVLPQTEATVAWVIQQLRSQQPKVEPDEDSDWEEDWDSDTDESTTLEEILLNADCALLEPRREELLTSPAVSEHVRHSTEARLEMYSWDLERCWQEFEMLSVNEKVPDEETEWSYVDAFIPIMGRFGKAVEDKTLALLSQTVDPTKPCATMREILAVQLAGWARLESAIPHLVTKLYRNDEFLNEDCSQALTQIGTDAVVEALAVAYPHGEFMFRICAIDAIGDIHTDLSVKQRVQWLVGEEDPELVDSLLYSLVDSFASEAIDAVRQQKEHHPAEYQDHGIISRLMQNCLLSGDRFPEYEAWLEQSNREREKERIAAEQYRESLKNPVIPPRSWSSPEESWQSDPLPPRQAPFEKTQKKVGRNDPCPCGSGKKFKNCCLKKSSSQ